MEAPAHTGDPCPDPTAHSSHTEARLEDQAAAAALARDHTEGSQPLDHKLSEASAAASLHYAKPKDLPSFPIVGVSNSTSSAGAAASLANANHKDFKLWKPDASANASKAAMLAKDYKPAPMWHHELGAASSKAALQAANKGADVKIWTPEKSSVGNSAAEQAFREGGDVKIWRPEKTEAGNSAAGQAMRKTTLSPQVDYGYTADGNRKALLAATGAMSGGNRRRAGSSPVVNKSYPDAANSAANALNAATIAHKPSTKGAGPTQLQYSSPALEASRITHVSSKNVSRDMYGSRPPVGLEVEERKKQDTIHAAAVSMAKQMYDLQQKSINQAAPKSDSHLAATKSIHGRKLSTASSVDEKPIPVYPNLQEAAQRLAAERLAKLRNEHAEYRDYYGTNKPQARNSLRGRPRRRASSDGDSDAKQSNKIRKEMSMFSNQLAEVDAKKQQKDRESLLAAAQRNVNARMSGMDQKVFADTGKVSPAMMEEWEAKAKAKAEADSSDRMVNHGRVDIGGGRFMDQADVDAAARAKVQPTLDEITVKAEKQRERDEQIRLEEEERKRVANEIRADEMRREMETKTAWRLFKENERKEKEAERARKAEEKRARKEEARKAKEVPAEQKVAAVGLVAEPKGESSEQKTVTTGSGTNDTEISTDAPALEPIAYVDQINVADIQNKPLEESYEGGQSQEIEPSATRDSMTEHSVSTAAEVMSLTSAERIAERVVSAPVASKSQELVNPVTALETAAVDYEEPPTPGLTTSATTATEDQAPASTARTVSTAATAPTTATTAEEPATTKAVEEPKPASTSKPVKTAPPITTTPSTSLDTSTRTTSVSAGTPTSPTKSGVRGWFKSKIARRASKPPKPESSSAQKGTTATESSTSKGATIPNTSATTTTESTTTKPTTTAPLSTSTSHNDSSSVREVAMAGRPSSSSSPRPSKSEASATALAALEGTTPAAPESGVVSPLSANEGEEKDLASEPAHLATTTGTGPGGWDRRDSTASSGISSLEDGGRTRERITGLSASEETTAKEAEPAALSKVETKGSEEGEFEEARDTFDDGLAPPPSLAALAGDGKAGGVGGKERSPVRDSKFQEIL